MERIGYVIEVKDGWLIKAHKNGAVKKGDLYKKAFDEENAKKKKAYSK